MGNGSRPNQSGTDDHTHDDTLSGWCYSRWYPSHRPTNHLSMSSLHFQLVSVLEAGIAGGRRWVYAGVMNRKVPYLLGQCPQPVGLQAARGWGQEKRRIYQADRQEGHK